MSAPRGPAALTPESRVQFLPGVGPKRALVFEKLGIVSLEQLVRHYPRTWLDARTFVRIADMRAGELVTVEGTIERAASLRTRGGRTDFVATLHDGSGPRLPLYFFGQPFLARTLKKGTRVVVSGELDAGEGRMMNPMFEVMEGEVAERLHVGRLVPVHALTKGLTARAMRAAVRAALEKVAALVPDPVPDTVRETHGLGPLAAALWAIHLPEDEAALEAARRRLAFEELFLLQSVLEIRRRALTSGGGLVTSAASDLPQRARAALPFALTDDQARALAEIAADMARPHPMHRMLLGDVGSGKTAVAYLAGTHAVACGFQVAFMAPTEILARQHGGTLAALATPVGVTTAVLTGATPAAERRALQTRLDAGEPLIVIGTQALLEDKVRLPNLGLVVVDEQHRFGVRQRATLAQKAVIPDVLVLTATPIPRTLQLAYYGDLHVSVLKARPAGRGRLVTRVAGEEKFPQVIEFLAKELAGGRQAYVVVPVIEDGGRADMRAAEAEFQRLGSHPVLAGFALGLLHGRMKGDDKADVMRRFAAGDIDVLVSTTVVEVGVDVPNATVLVVENAERFGLTQLHQLRGRVGRGAHRSVCVLVPGPAASALAKRRLELVAETEDGFKIAEADLEMRGPGELWGVRQSGLPRLKLADLARDAALLEQTRAAAREVVTADPELQRPEHAALRATLFAYYREPIELALAG